MDTDAAKRAAAQGAAAYVEEGMLVGVGTGSTARWFISRLAEMHAGGLEFGIVPTSRRSESLARDAGLPVVELGPAGVDVAVDGADAVDRGLRVIKGAGGAHVRERLVAAASGQFIVIIDATKLRPDLRGPLPLELLGFGIEHTLAELSRLLGAPVILRGNGDGAVAVSDNGNPLADGQLLAGADLDALAATLDAHPGVVGHGLFLGMAAAVLVGEPGGGVEILTP